MQYIIKRISLIEKLSYINIGTVSVYSLTDSNHCQCPTIVTVNIVFLTAVTRDGESRMTPFLQMRKLNIVVTGGFLKATHTQTFMPLLLEGLCSQDSMLSS